MTTDTVLLKCGIKQDRVAADSSREPCPFQAEFATSAPGKHRARLFVPLSDGPFRWFASGAKRWELRRLGRQYTLANLREGRAVELRRGYSNPAYALFGSIGKAHLANSVVDFFRSVPFAEVLPECHSQEEATRVASDILRIETPDTPVIGFQVNIEKPLELAIDPIFLPWIEQGRKRATIREGRRELPKGLCEFASSSGRHLRVWVTGTEFKPLAALDNRDAKRDGFESVEELRKILAQYYPHLGDSDLMTIVAFRPLESLGEHTSQA